MHRFSGLLGWLAVTAAASGISLAAVTLVGASIGDPVAEPLSAEQVRRQLELAGGTGGPTGTPTSGPTSAPATGSPTAPTGTVTPTATTGSEPGQRRVFDTDGGSVAASCTDGLVWLEWWSPASGFSADHVDRGPATEAELEFESDDDRYRLELSCRSGRPVLQTEHDDRGDNSGPGGGDGGGSGPG